MDNPGALPTTPQAPPPQQKRSIHLVPKPDSSICYRQPMVSSPRHGLAAASASLTEQADEIGRGCLGKRAFTLAAGGSQCGERVRNEARLAAAAPHRHWCQVRSVSLDQQALNRQCRRDTSKLLALLERQYARKRNAEADSHRRLRKREAGAETVQHSSQGPCLMLGLEYRNHMLVGASGVHHERQTTCPRGGNMRLKYSDLNGLRTSVVVEVEPAFTDADNLRMSSQPQQSIDRDIRLGVGIMRMNADRAEHIVVAFGDGEDAGKARERRADRQHRRDAHAPRLIDDRVDLASELGMVEVAVTVDQHHRALVS